jgi:hypothetical protein
MDPGSELSCAIAVPEKPVNKTARLTIPARTLMLLIGFSLITWFDNSLLKALKFTPKTKNAQERGVGSLLDVIVQIKTWTSLS